MALVLGPDWQRELWKSSYRLRFELSQGGSYVNMFTSAYDRARSLARAALPGDGVTAIVAAYPDPKRELSAKWRGWTKGDAFEILRDMGVPTDAAIASWDGFWWSHGQDDEVATPWRHRAVQLTWGQADILLFNQIAHEIGIAPQAPVFSKFVNLERGVSVNAYDDRGMDITALTPSAISSLYVQFDEWLLDYDRARMGAVFGLV